MDYYSAIKRNEALIGSTTWTNLKNIILQQLPTSYVFYTKYKCQCYSLKSSHPSLLPFCRGLSSVLCDDLEGWDGEDRREVQEGGHICIYIADSLVAQKVKRGPATWKTQVRSLGWDDPLEKEMATHFNTLAWKIPCVEEPGRLQSMWSQRVGHDWVTSLSLFTFMADSLCCIAGMNTTL